MRYIIDRFEGSYAVCEDEKGNMINIEIAHIPRDAKEGDVLMRVVEHYAIDINETQIRKAKIQKMMEELWKS